MNLVQHDSLMHSSSCQTLVMVETFFRHNHWLIYPASHLCQEVLAEHSTTDSCGLKLASYYFTYLTQFTHYSSMTLHWAWGHEYVEATWLRNRSKGEEDEVEIKKFSEKDTHWDEDTPLSNSDHYYYPSVFLLHVWLDCTLMSADTLLTTLTYYTSSLFKHELKESVFFLCYILVTQF